MIKTIFEFVFSIDFGMSERWEDEKGNNLSTVKKNRYVDIRSVGGVLADIRKIQIFSPYETKEILVRIFFFRNIFYIFTFTQFLILFLN